MKRSIYVPTVLLLANMAYGQVMWQVKTDEVKKWHYAGGDEFNDTQVNLDKWKWSADWGNAVIGQSVYFTYGGNVFLKDGEAHFIAKKEDIMGHVWPWEYDSVLLKKMNLKVVDEKLPFKYTAGSLWSKKKYKYGYFECRFKSNSEKGIWPAFWLYAGRENDEIDWFELKGERADEAHVDVHCPNGCNNYRGGFLNLKRGWGGWLKFEESLSKDYNVISGEWNENYMAWYVNGQPMCYFEHRYDSSMWLIVNTSVASNNNGSFSPAPDAGTKFPNDFVVDYVRVWTDKDTASLKGSEFNLSERTMPKESASTGTRMKKPLKHIYKKKVLDKELGQVTFLPLGNAQYSLTFSANKFTSAKVEIVAAGNKKVKEFDIKKPGYLNLDLRELENGTYTISISVSGKTLTHSFPLQKLIRG